MNASDIYNITLTADKQSAILNAEEEAAGRGPYKWLPTIDSISPNPFMPEHPMQVLKSGNQKDIPVIMGVTKDDGGLIPAYAYWDKLDALNENFTSIFGPQGLSGVSAGEATELDKKKAEAVMRFYLGSGRNFTQDSIQEMIDLFGDLLFNFPTYKALQLHSHSSSQPVFMYELAHKPSKTLMDIFGKDTGASSEDWGVAHGDDLSFIFNKVFGIEGAIETEEDKDVMEQMTTMWTNFAKHGDPTPYQDGDLIIWEPFEVLRIKT